MLENSSGVPCMLVGTKGDLLKNENILDGLNEGGVKPVTKEEVRRGKRDIEIYKIIWNIGNES